jgi:hypothetical protein
MIPYAVIMDEQIPRLEAFFKRLVVDKNNDDRDDNSSREYWKFIHPDDVESWSLELLLMTANMHFVHKFKNSPIFLPISYKERIKEVLYGGDGRVDIYCETMGAEPYLFTICVDYAKAQFQLPHFLHSFENSQYESLMTEIEEQIDRKMWINKEGNSLSAKSMASRLKQVLLSIATMTALYQCAMEQMRPLDLTGRVMSQGGSQGSELAGPQGVGSNPQGALSV